MSTLGSALNVALRAIEANQYGLALASNNIANAQTPGYTRQQMITQAGPAWGGAISVGTGVQVVGTEAVRDRMVETRLRQETSSQKEQELKHQALSDVEMQFDETGDTGLLPLLTDFFNSFHALSADPTSLNRRNEVATNAERLSEFFNTRGNAIRDMETRMDRSLRQDVDKVNNLSGKIADLTDQIMRQEPGNPAFELRDQRSVLVGQLSQLVGVHELESEGSYQLSIGSNRPLVVNGASFALTVDNDPNGLAVVRSGIHDITHEISGGQMSARVDLRDKVFPGYIHDLDQMAFELAGHVNSIHSTSYDLDGTTGTAFFSPLGSANDAARNLKINPAVIADPRKVAASRQAGGSDNQAAIEMGNLLHSSVFTGGSIVEQYSSFVFKVGRNTADAELNAEQHGALATQLENRRQQISGVSIDEESVNILQFQRAFQASARVVSVVDELLELTLTLGA